MTEGSKLGGKREECKEEIPAGSRGSATLPALGDAAPVTRERDPERVRDREISSVDI